MNASVYQHPCTLTNPKHGQVPMQIKGKSTLPFGQQAIKRGARAIKEESFMHTIKFGKPLTYDHPDIA